MYIVDLNISYEIDLKLTLELYMYMYVVDSNISYVLTASFHVWLHMNLTLKFHM